MLRTLILGTLLFVGPFLSMSWAQNKTEPTETRPPLPGTLQKTFQWDYTCPAAELAHSFVKEEEERARAT
jgi:hypothetical protein